MTNVIDEVGNHRATGAALMNGGDEKRRKEKADEALNDK